MKNLSKQQRDEYATAFAILALYDGEAEISSDQINTLLSACGVEEVEGFYPVIFANLFKDRSKLSSIVTTPSGGGGGGGGGAVASGAASSAAGGAAAEAKEEEKKEEEEEMDLGGGMDMFGGSGGGGGGGGDY
jgi:ribosomal protein L12E/L44/L45/RPP1/RPP2